MVKETTLHILIMVSCLLLSVAVNLIPGFSEGFASAHLLSLTLVLFVSITCGLHYAFIAGALSPIVCWFLFAGGDFMHSALPLMIALAAGGLSAGIVYSTLKTSFGGIAVGVLVNRVAFAAANMGVRLGNGEAYTFEMVWQNEIVGCWKGLLLAMVILPLFIVLLRKLGVMRVLRDEWIDR